MSGKVVVLPLRGERVGVRDTSRQQKLPSSGHQTPLLQNARRLRRDGTDAEQRLWSSLRQRQIGGMKVRRQHPYGPYILDFYCVEKKLAIKADGDQHFTEEGKAADAARSQYLATRGIRVLRFTNLEILQETQAVV